MSNERPPIIEENLEHTQERRTQRRRRGVILGVIAAGAAVVIAGGVVVARGINEAADSISADEGSTPTPQPTLETGSTPPPTTAPTTTAPETTAASATATSVSSPSRTPSPTPTTTSRVPSPTPTPTPAATTQAAPPAAQTEFAIDCDADPGYCGPDGGAPVYNGPFLGAYALNANANGDVSTGIRYPHGSEVLTPLCRGTGDFSGWLMVITGSWAEPNRSGQGRADSGYMEAAVLPGAANAVGNCTDSQDYSGNFN